MLRSWRKSGLSPGVRHRFRSRLRAVHYDSISTILSIPAAQQSRFQRDSAAEGYPVPEEPLTIARQFTGGDGGDAEPCPVGTPDRSLPTSFDEGSSVPTGRSSVVGTYPALKRRATIDGPSGAGGFPILSSASGLSPGGWPIVSGLRVRGSYPFISSQRGLPHPSRVFAGGWASARSTAPALSRLRAVHCDSMSTAPFHPRDFCLCFLGVSCHDAIVHPAL